MTDPIQPTLQQPAKPDLRTLLSALGLEVAKNVNCVRIGSIIDFNPANQTATVQIAQQKVTSISPTGVRTLQSFAPLVSVPVFVLGGGGLSATFPITQGDECLVLFNDREIDNWLLAGGTETAPTTPRLHDLSDGMCFVGFRSYPRSLAGYSTNSAQLRTDDGAAYWEVTAAGVLNGVSPTSINLTAPQVNITASDSVNVTTPVETITGILSVENVDGASNPCTINGEIRATGDMVAGYGSADISLLSHRHTGVQAGGSDTGEPV